MVPVKCFKPSKNILTVLESPNIAVLLKIVA